MIESKYLVKFDFKEMKMTTSAKYFRVIGVLICVMYTCAVSSDWPCFHGSDRTNKSKETGLLKKWPEKGPELLWTASGLGIGYSSVSTSGGSVYTAGVVDKVNWVFAFDNTGKLLWRKQAGGAWEGKNAFARGFEGSRSTPTVDNGIVYYFSNNGSLTALDARGGAEKWSVDLRKKYETDEDVPKYAFSESPFIDGEKLYISPFGKKASVVCLDKKTG
ncbi:MAG: PQQ-like beta-propeller repeat protein, partial [Chitinispirillales bacterium]|nr:PQQ-like beta-propeller repeat protein [Chitinispirillales bacterium]